MPAVAQGCEEEEVIGAEGAHVRVGGCERCLDIRQDGRNSGTGGQIVANILTGIISNSA